MAKPIRLLKDLFDGTFDAARAAEVPLIVRRRCTPHQLAVWLAIRVLLDVRSRSAFGLREVAAEANLTAIPRVGGWIDDLVGLGFLEIVGYEDVPNLKQPRRPIYKIPWQKIHQQNLKEVEAYLIALGIKIPEGKIHGPHQLALNLDGSVIEGSQGPVIEGSHMDGRTDGLMDGRTHARASRKKTGRPRTPPPHPPDRPPLASHPLDLWRKATSGYRAIHDEELTRLAAQYDASTGGFGWHWVGEAIHAAASTEDQRGLGGVIKTLARWEQTGDWGSLPPPKPRKESTNGQRPPTGARAPGRSRLRLVGSAPDRPGGPGGAGTADDELTPERRAEIIARVTAEFEAREASGQ